MNRALSWCVVVVVACLFQTATAMAVPNLISYQGVLNDSSGEPVSATVSMTFSIYDVASGGTALWSEIQSVQVSNGVFNVRLGLVQQLTSPVLQISTLYLGIQVGADPEMTPRQLIVSQSYVHAPIPIGSIMAWAKNLLGVPDLPDGWVECNGQFLSDTESPLNGRTIPDLNTSNRFLRGNTESGGYGGVESHNHFSPASKWHDKNLFILSGDYGAEQTGVGTYGMINESYFSYGYSGGTITNFKTSSVNAIPPYYEIVWIMKVK